MLPPYFAVSRQTFPHGQREPRTSSTLRWLRSSLFVGERDGAEADVAPAGCKLACFMSIPYAHPEEATASEPPSGRSAASVALLLCFFHLVKVAEGWSIISVYLVQSWLL